MTKNIKVLYSTNYKSSSDLIPKIQMEGKWLQELGFLVGDLLSQDSSVSV